MVIVILWHLALSNSWERNSVETFHKLSVYLTIFKTFWKKERKPFMDRSDTKTLRTNCTMNFICLFVFYVMATLQFFQLWRNPSLIFRIDWMIHFLVMLDVTRGSRSRRRREIEMEDREEICYIFLINGRRYSVIGRMAALILQLFISVRN